MAPPLYPQQQTSSGSQLVTRAASIRSRGPVLHAGAHKKAQEREHRTRPARLYEPVSMGAQVLGTRSGLSHLSRTESSEVTHVMLESLRPSFGAPPKSAVPNRGNAARAEQRR